MFLLIKNNLAELRQCHEELVSNNNSSKEDLYRLKYRDVDIGVLENVFKTINTMNSVNQLYLQTFLANQAAIASQPHFEKQFAALQSMNSMFAANAGGPGASGLRATTPKRSAEPVRANSQRTAISTPSLLTRGDSGYLATPISDFKRSNTNESSLSENSTAVVTQSSRASKKLPVPSPVKVREKQEQPVDLGEFSQVMADVLNERLAIGSAEFSTSVPAIDNMVAVSQCSTIVAEASSKDSPLYTDESLGKQKLQMESADSIDMAEMDGNRTGKSLSKKFLKKLASSVNSYNSGNKNTDLECPTDTSPSRPPKDWKK
jgi:hypothetical protein